MRLFVNDWKGQWRATLMTPFPSWVENQTCAKTTTLGLWHDFGDWGRSRGQPKVTTFKTEPSEIPKPQPPLLLPRSLTLWPPPFRLVCLSIQLVGWFPWHVVMEVEIRRGSCLCSSYGRPWCAGCGWHRGSCLLPSCGGPDRCPVSGPGP